MHARGTPWLNSKDIKMASKSSWGKTRKLPSGKFQASHLNPDGIRVNAPHTFRTKTLAQVWLAEQQTLMAQGKWTSKVSKVETNFKDFALKHFELQTNSKGKSLHGSTKVLYQRLLENHLEDFHSLSLPEINSQYVEKWWIEKTKTRKITTAAKAYKVLHSVLNRALLDGLIDTNPCRIRGAHTANTGKELYVPTVDEVGILISNMMPKFQAAVVLAGYGGLRYGEWSALTRKDIEIVSDGTSKFLRIHVTKAISKIDRDLVPGTTKSASGVREIDLSSLLTPIISKHLLEHTEPGSDGLLFPGTNGGYLRHDVFIKQFNKAARISNIPQITPHALRHFGATQKVNLGMNFADLQKWLGDSTSQAALGYVHASQTQIALFREMPISESLMKISNSNNHK